MGPKKKKQKKQCCSGRGEKLWKAEENQKKSNKSKEGKKIKAIDV